MTPVGYEKQSRVYFLTFCINHSPMGPATKTIKAYICSAANPTALLKTLKIMPTPLPTIAGNASTAVLASLFSEYASLFNHLFKTPSFFDGEPYPPSTPAPPPPKTPVTASTIAEIAI